MESLPAARNRTSATGIIPPTSPRPGQAQPTLVYNPETVSFVPSASASATGTNEYGDVSPFDAWGMRFLPGPRPFEEQLGPVAERLLDPPATVWPQGRSAVVSIEWVVSLIGADEFEYNEQTDRMMLRRDSPWRRFGYHYLPYDYYVWIRGNPSDETSRQKDYLLTPGMLSGL
jgi:hypothetical protein